MNIGKGMKNEEIVAGWLVAGFVREKGVLKLVPNALAELFSTKECTAGSKITLVILSAKT